MATDWCCFLAFSTSWVVTDVSQQQKVKVPCNIINTRKNKYVWVVKTVQWITRFFIKICIEYFHAIYIIKLSSKKERSLIYILNWVSNVWLISHTSTNLHARLPLLVEREKTQWIFFFHFTLWLDLDCFEEIAYRYLLPLHTSFCDVFIFFITISDVIWE